jgi:hypothetical protein
MLLLSLRETCKLSLIFWRKEREEGEKERGKGGICDGVESEYRKRPNVL